jgi:hypothetical protein
MAGAYVGEVEADSVEEALEKAESMGHDVSLCHQCSHKIEDPELTEFHAEEIV